MNGKVMGDEHLEVIFEIVKGRDVELQRPTVFRAVVIDVDAAGVRSVRDILEFPFTSRERVAKHIAYYFGEHAGVELRIHMQHHDVDLGKAVRLDTKFIKIMEAMV